MGVGANVYSGAAALGRADAYFTFLCSVVLACIFVAVGVAIFAMPLRTANDASKATVSTRLLAVLSCLIACCLVASGLAISYVTTKSKPLAAMGGASVAGQAFL